MTREEAIELIESARKTMYLPKSKEYISDLGYALEIAIKALEQSSYNSIKTELKPCEDAVSRQAAIDAINKIHPVDTDYDCTLYDKIDVMYVLKDLPPVNPQNCDKCEVGNPCLYCKHEFEERSGEE